MFVEYVMAQPERVGECDHGEKMSDYCELCNDRGADKQTIELFYAKQKLRKIREILA